MTLYLNYDLGFSDLYRTEGLVKLDRLFINYLSTKNYYACQKLQQYRQNNKLSSEEYSKFIVEFAAYLDNFIAHLFDIEDELEQYERIHNEDAVIFKCKKAFVQKRATKLYSLQQIEEFDIQALRKYLKLPLNDCHFDERSLSIIVMNWLKDAEKYKEQLEQAAKFFAWCALSSKGQEIYKDYALFKLAKKVDFANLLRLKKEQNQGIDTLFSTTLKERDGFNLTSAEVTLKEAMDNATYCIYCHNQGKDSCSKGMKDKEDKFKVNPLGVSLTGCPLGEKISEMNYLKSNGYIIGALAAITIDNPMVAATGYRICNDCMKACIYQKQDPVDIPKIETRILDDVLNLSWGFEIYSLLTRWNPLNLSQFLPKESTNNKVLIAGLGPAGFTLSHYLLNSGHTVIAVDGNKIELNDDSKNFAPIRNIKEHFNNLEDRIIEGFGGVIEYGITSRWDKNYLKIIRLLLDRRSNFAMYGGVRLGSNITIEQAWELGFDHIALCTGAGKPNLLNMPNAMARGVKAASDFLMALQLTGASKDESISNLQIRLPVIVIGGGLTAVDAATEAQAYYIKQVEKFLTRYEIIAKRHGEKYFLNQLTVEELEIAQEFINHGKKLRLSKSYKDKINLIKSWGGVHICYRKSIQDAPSYRLNHEELQKGLDEGIGFIEYANPVAVEVDKYYHVSGVKIIKEDHKEYLLESKTVLIAAGTIPNTVIARENPNLLAVCGKFFTLLDEQGNQVKPEYVAKPKNVNILTSIDHNKSISFFGDLHPSYAGNVVKAMASAKNGFPIINRVLTKHMQNSKIDLQFLSKINDLLISKVQKVNRLTPNIVEVIIYSPLAVNNFQPGQFYRLQNYAKYSKNVGNINMLMEGIALTGASVDKKQNLISTIVLEVGGSSNLCANLQEGEPIIFMGPTGTPTEIVANENVMLVGGGLGNAVLFSIGKAFREKGSKILYFAGYKKLQDRYKTEEIENAADYVIWCCDEGKFSDVSDKSINYHGNIIEAIKAYSNGELGVMPIKMNEIHRIIAIGSDKMMEAVNKARNTILKDKLHRDHIAIASINSPMQCMMKEICAQCIQEHIDPVTGIKKYIYSCSNQDQRMEEVSFKHLSQRLSQNSVQEKLTALMMVEE